MSDEQERFVHHPKIPKLIGTGSESRKQKQQKQLANSGKGCKSLFCFLKSVTLTQLTDKQATNSAVEFLANTSDYGNESTTPISVHSASVTSAPVFANFAVAPILRLMLNPLIRFCLVSSLPELALLLLTLALPSKNESLVLSVTTK